MVGACFTVPGILIKQVTVFAVILVGPVLANRKYYTFNLCD